MFYVEVNDRCSSDEFEKLLLLLKHWEDDEQFARSIVVVSSTHTAMDVTIGFDELRANCITVGNLTKDEAKKFIMNAYSSFRGEIADERKQLADESLLLLGTRVLHLLDFLSRCKVLQLKTCTDLKVELNKFVSYNIMTYKRALIHVLEELGKIDDKSFIAELPLKEAVALRRLCKLTSKSIITLLAETHPYPFYLDPTMDTLIVGSHFMPLAMK